MSRAWAGMSLIELLLALLLGTLVVVTASGVFVVNRKTMATTQGIAQMQHTLQAALELLARELRQAGGNPCSRQIPLANRVDASSSRWWSHLGSSKMSDGRWSLPWRNTVRGLTAADLAVGTGAGARVAGSDAIELLSAESGAATVVSHDGSRFVLNTSAHGFSSGNLLLVCDARQASVFQGRVAGAIITHPASDPHCSGQLGLPGGCAAEPFVYAPHALMARWNPLRWYLGHNGRGGTSLYRITLDGNGQGVTRQEMVEDVSALEFRYLLAGTMEAVDMSGVAGRWQDVIAVQIGLSVTASGLRAEDGGALTRQMVQTVALRNRVP